jgi:CPA2 family monovalent cation:H+ antiporter-2
LESKIPIGWTAIIKGYKYSRPKSVKIETEFSKYIKKVSRTVALYAGISFAIIILASQFLLPIVRNEIGGMLGKIVYAGVTILVIAPFINIFLRAGNTTLKNKLKEGANLSGKNKLQLIILNLIRSILALILLAFVLMPLFPQYRLLMLCISLLIAVILVFAIDFTQQRQAITARFMENFNEEHDVASQSITKKFREDLESKSLHIERIEVPQNSVQVGKTLGELNFRNITGTSIVSIIRGNQIINIPDKNTRIYPYDKMVVVGSDEEVSNFISLLDSDKYAEENTEVTNYRVELEQHTIEPDSYAIGKSIKQLAIQQETGCIIASIERNGTMINKFDSKFELQQGDVLWLAGEKHNLENFELLLPVTKEYKY